jgi:hypothetical protein
MAMTEIDHLKKQISKTGYPLEIEISSLLEGKWEHIINTDTYFDRESQKLRDIDICAHKWPKQYMKMYPLAPRFNLTIECKKNEDFAWVFFPRPIEFEIEEISGQYLDSVQISTRDTENDQIVEAFFTDSFLHYKSMKNKAVCYSEFCIKGKKESHDKKRREIFKAQNQLMKYIDYSIEQSIKSTYPYGIYPFEVFFPCIVFDGTMYEAIVRDGDLQLKESDHLLLRTSYRSQFAIYERSILIDVVARDHFEHYLDLIDEDVKSLCKQMNRNKLKIARKIDELQTIANRTRTKS